jgi:hypothetical protein
MNSSLETVASFVWGGKVESINFKPGSTTADVLFLKPEDCMKYYHATSNGVPFPDQPKRFIDVTLHADADPVHDRVRGFIEHDVTRVVYVTNIPTNLGLKFFENVAKGGKHELSVEKIRVGHFGKNRSVEFRMGSICGQFFHSILFPFAKSMLTAVLDAIKLMSTLERDDDLEPFNKYYGADPCESATGYHKD